jgi:hypothetical protein
MGASDDTVKQMVFEALKTESPEYEHKVEEPKLTFEPKALPEGSLSLKEWAGMVDDLPEEYKEKFIGVLGYIVDRGYDPYDGNFYWSPGDGYSDRVLIPFTYQGKIVGNTARKITDGRPKYLSDQHPHFVFNVDAQLESHKYVFVTEGPFDALAIGGVALLTNDVAEQQERIINSLGSEVIVIPDQDEAGLVLIKRAIECDWAVAFPNWDSDVKDVADAVQRYGRLFVTVDAIKTAQKGEIKLTMALKQLEQRLKR